MGLAGIGEDNSFITNVLKYRPPGNRTPTPEEVSSSRPYLQEEFRLLGKPQIIISVGGTALNAILAGKEDRPKGSVSNLAGKIIELNRRTDLVVMFHPSFALRQAENSPMHKRIEGCWIKLGRVLRGRGIL
jgi:DNA polymerase